MISPKVLKNNFKFNEPLAKHTSLKVGGKALVWFEPQTRKDLANFLKSLKPKDSFFVIGSGSNLLIKDGRVDKIFIHLSSPFFGGIKLKKNILTVGAGLKNSRLVSFLLSKDICGYEFLAGIPGTIGGALAMNAGAKVDIDIAESYREMKDVVCEVEVLDKNGKRRILSKKDCSFTYRNSGLKPFIILSTKLKLKADRNKNVRIRIKKLLRQRMAVQDWGAPSAGSFFKNPKNDSAGRLIDACGLKGEKVGGAQVSKSHANFIINTGRASSKDIIKLMEIIQKRVYNRFKIYLEPEVKIVS